MKLSEMTNDQATEALLRLTGPFENICKDKAFLQLLEEIKATNPEESLLTLVGRMLPDIVRFVLVQHKQDLYEIVGALLIVPVGDVGGLNFIQTVNVVRDSYDDILESFFTHSARAVKTSGGASV